MFNSARARRYLRIAFNTMVLLASCPTISAVDCAPAGAVTPICGFQRPEDLEALPGGKLILVSEYGALSGARPGKLTVYRPADGAITPLFPTEASAPPASTGKPWGDPSCTAAPGAEFSPHGIHHSAIGGGDRVLVVNHGGREAVELFELELLDDDTNAKLIWRGCVPVPDGTWINDVVGLPGGGLAVTHMVERGTEEPTLIEVESSRADTGEVLEWMPAGGWRKLPGTAGGLPNGIEVAADARTLYINYYFGDAVAAIERASGRQLWRTELPAPDNSSWHSDGRLLIASHRESLEAIIACGKAEGASFCASDYQIVALDPNTGAPETLFEGGREAIGAVTVALPFADKLYFGSFVGTRMARVDMAR